MTRYLGGLITADETQVIPADNYEDTSAPGVWTLAEAEMLTKQSKWPTAGNQNIRAVFAGGFYNAYDIMDYVTISSTGNATDFGDLTSPRAHCAGCASATRGITGGGLTTDAATTGEDFIDYITIASTGNGTDFGNLSQGRNSLASCNSSTRGIFLGGRVGLGSTVNTIDYITIASAGDATDFGDNNNTVMQAGGTSSSTRGVFGGDYDGLDIMSYITIGSTGDATDFGDLSVGRHGVGAFSNGTRGVFGGGTLSSGHNSNVIDYITIASTGNATDFGDITSARQDSAGASSSTRGIFAGGGTSPRLDIMDYVTISSTGNATDFGDLTQARNALSGMSNANGGLQ